MQSLEELLTPNAVFATARRRWGYDHDLYQGSSVSTALKNRQPKVFSVEIPIYSSRVTIYHNTNASTLAANPDEYENGANDDNRTLVDNESTADKDSLYKGSKGDMDGKSVLEEDHPPVLELAGKRAITTSHRSRYMRSRYTVELIGYPGKEITLDRGSHYLSIKKKFKLDGVEYIVEGKKYDIIIRNLTTSDIVCRYEIKTFAKHKSGVLRLSMSPKSSLYDRAVMFSVIMVVGITHIYSALANEVCRSLNLSLKRGMLRWKGCSMLVS